jgi:hypothetical protein
MEIQNRFRDVLTHPITTASAIFAVVANVLSLPFIDAVWSVAWSNAGTLFTVLSVSGFTLAPEVPWLPAEPLSIAALVAGTLFVATQVRKLWMRLNDRLEES